ncbi:presequence protease [Marchantia polymorpha subsp. ruderalis]|uniref:Peptidase M16C associated domain-containing protein n=3 Tax=Marchantia polymorpha TaxID=3197 RepID=A0AAF6B9D2_MARPO|nr:hypothetical protein Mp_4g13030 [Marchantia polymorpha subsp. ruderalis]
MAKQQGYEVISEQFIDEYNSTAILYRHKKTGAEIMSVSNSDEKKVFGIVFRTPAQDSLGIPHILQRSVMCGSRKYPLKNPVGELFKSSLDAYAKRSMEMDRTCFRVASTNLQDFYNLVDVHLDAVFFPRCVNDVQIFQQEGWHYELNESSEDMTYKGGVFNHLKGLYSEPEFIMAQFSLQASFPDNTYGVNIGGDPTVIPDSTFEQFQEFHRKFYHPSNARLWFYGDDDPNERLRVISTYLDSFEASQSAKESEVGVQKLFTEPKRVVEKYAAGEAGDTGAKHLVYISWVLCDEPLDAETELALGILNLLMLGTPASPLEKALMDSGLGEALFHSGLSDDILQPAFGIGMKGVAADKTVEVEELLLKTLNRLVDEGFTAEAVEASINTYELSLRENKTASYSRGLSLMLCSVAKWVYGGDPFEALRFAKPLEALKERIANEGVKGVFSPLIKKFILDNTHRVTVELQPDNEKGVKDEAAEAERLAKVKASMTKEDIAELVRATEELRVRQETPDPPEALRAVPRLSLKDIPKEPIYVPIAVGEINGATVLRHDIFTNGVLYTEVAFDMSTLRADLLPLVPLFCESLLGMGTKDMDFVELSQVIGRKTGGISVSACVSSVHGKKEALTYLMIQSKGMANQIADVLNLMKVVLKDVQFNEQRVQQLVSRLKSDMESQVVVGCMTASIRMNGMLNVEGWLREQSTGVSYLNYLRSLEKLVEDDWPAVCQSLEDIRSAVLGRKGVIVNLTADEKILTSAEPHVSNFLDAFPETSGDRTCTWNPVLHRVNEGLVIPTKVNYVGKAACLYDAGYEMDGCVFVITEYINETWLSDRVRVSGGAYRCSCYFDEYSGVFSYLSDRDPNLLKTLDNYDGTVEFLKNLELDDEALTKAIFAAIKETDPYELPDAKGFSSMRHYIQGVTWEKRQQRREQILSTSVEDLRKFGSVLEYVRDSGVVVAVASADDIAAANEAKPGFLDVVKVL